MADPERDAPPPEHGGPVIPSPLPQNQEPLCPGADHPPSPSCWLTSGPTLEQQCVAYLAKGLPPDAAAREAAEKEARLQEILEQIRRDDAQARYDRYTGRSRDDDDDDYDRGRERERER